MKKNGIHLVVIPWDGSSAKPRKGLFDGIHPFGSGLEHSPFYAILAFRGKDPSMAFDAAWRSANVMRPEDREADFTVPEPDVVVERMEEFGYEYVWDVEYLVE